MSFGALTEDSQATFGPFEVDEGNDNQEPVENVGKDGADAGGVTCCVRGLFSGSFDA